MPLRHDPSDNAALLTNVGLETLTPDTDPSLSFELRIDRGPALVWDERDDLIRRLRLRERCLRAGAQVIDCVEILGSESFDPLVTGEFREESVSPD